MGYGSRQTSFQIAITIKYERLYSLLCVWDVGTSLQNFYALKNFQSA